MRNQERANWFWRMEEENRCEECRIERYILEHMLNGCGGEGKSNCNRVLMLDNTGSRIHEIKR